MGPVRNLKPNLFTTLERPRGVTQSRPPDAFPEVSIGAARHPRTPWSVRAGPAPGLTQVQSRPTSPCLRRLSHPCGSPAPPSASVALSPSRGRAAPASPPHGLHPPHSPAAHAASSGTAGAGRTRPAALRRTGYTTGAWRLGRQEASTTGRGGAFRLSLCVEERDHRERGGALVVVSPEEQGGGGVRAKLHWLTLGRRAGLRREGVALKVLVSVGCGGAAWAWPHQLSL